MKYDYNVFFEEKLKFIAQNSQKILDVGGGRPFQKILSKHRDLLRDKDYITLDIDPDTRPTVIGDAHNMPFPDSSFDAVTHIYVFEHLHNPQKAANEILRVLKPGGFMLGIIPFIHPYHARKGSYRDYWRFSEDGVRILFEDFRRVEIKKIGRYFRAAINFLPFLWRVRGVLEPIAYLLDKLLINESRSTTAGYMIFAQK